MKVSEGEAAQLCFVSEQSSGSPKPPPPCPGWGPKSKVSAVSAAVEMSLACTVQWLVTVQC